MAKTQHSVMDRRRVLVQSRALRGYSTREIEAQFVELAAKHPYEAVELGAVNPATGKAWDHSTISRDLSFLRKQWREEAAAKLAEHKARELAELREHRKAAWKAGALSEVRQGIQVEVALLGTAEAERVLVSTPPGEAVRMVDQTPQNLAQVLAILVEAGVVPAPGEPGDEPEEGTVEPESGTEDGPGE